MWNVPAQAVVDYADVHEMVTAVTFSLDGSKACVGTMKGKCRFYRCDDKRKLEYEAQIGNASSCRCLLVDLNMHPPTKREPWHREVTCWVLLAVCLACRACCLPGLQGLLSAIGGAWPAGLAVCNQRCLALADLLLAANPTLCCLSARPQLPPAALRCVALCQTQAHVATFKCCCRCEK